MNPIRILRTLVKYTGISIALIAILLVIVSAVGIKLPLNFLKDTIQDAAQNAIGRELSIDGSIGLSPGFSPEVFVQGVQLANPEGGDAPGFVTVDELSLQIHLLPLLSKQIHIGNVMLSGVGIDLVKPVAGEPNWTFEPTMDDDTKNKTERRDQESTGMRLIAIDSVQLSDLALSYRDEVNPTHYDLNLSTGMLQAPEGEPGRFEVEGKLNALPLSLQLEFDPLQKIIEQNFPLKLKAISKIGATSFDTIIEALDSGMQISVDLQGKALNQLGDRLGLALPAVNNYKASASVGLNENELKISAFHADIDNSDIDAEFIVSRGKSPTQISGTIDINTLELDPFLKSADQTELPQVDQASNLPEQEENASAEELSNLVQQLSNYAADLRVNIERLTAGGLVITDSDLQLNLSAGKLDTPVNVVLNGIPMEGNFSLNHADSLVTAQALLEIQNRDIGDLEQWFNLDGIDGSLGKFSLNIETSGQTLQSLAEQVSADLVIEGAELRYGSAEIAEGVAFTLERMSASVAEQNPLAINVKGALLDQAFTLDMTGGNLNHLVTGSEWPLEITAQGAGAELRVEGTVRKPGEQTGTELSLNLSGSKLGDLHAWLGVSKDADAAYAFQAHANTHLSGWEVSSYEIGLGETGLKGKVSATDTPDGMLLGAQINSELINLPELTSFFKGSSSTTIAAIETGEPQEQDANDPNHFREPALEIPILPKGIALPDMDIEVSLEELRLESLSFNDIGFSGSVRNGILKPSPFSMQLGKAVFSGEVAFDSLSTPPSTSLLLETKDIDIGNTLDELAIAKGIDLTAALLRLNLDLKGHKLGGILDRSSITAEIREGQWVLTDSGSGSTFPMKLNQGTLHVEPNSPFTLVNEVEYSGEQIVITITLDRLIAKRAGDEVNLKIDVRHRDNALALVGTSPLPISFEDTVMSVNMSGTSTGSLGSVTGLSVPEFGAYEMAGRLSRDAQGYYLEKMKVQIGESVIDGTASLKTNLPVPEFDVHFVSEHFQLNDFKTPEQYSADQSATEDSSAVSSEDSTETIPESEEPASDTENARADFKPQNLALANGSFNLKAKNVVSGEDWLGEGEINLNLRDSKLDIAPIKVKLPGGNFEASLSMAAKDEELNVRMNAMIDQFDYGVLARRNNPETKMSGIIDLDLALESRTRSLDGLMAEANGYIDFVLLPEYFEAGAIDLWAASLLVAVLPKLGSNVSLINCVIARFDISDGHMQEKELYLDTSKLRARGKGKINFKDQTISYILKPKAKNPGLFQVQAPLKIEGSFADIELGLHGGIIGSALGMVATTVTVPIRVLMGKNVPRDGSDICAPLAARKVQ